MGGANNICTDKTGTLTKNLMTVTKFWCETKNIEKFSNEDKLITPATKELVGIGLCLNSDAQPKVSKGVF